MSFCYPYFNDFDSKKDSHFTPAPAMPRHGIPFQLFLLICKDHITNIFDGKQDQEQEEQGAC